jgi:hypothetical protein
MVRAPGCTQTLAQQIHFLPQLRFFHIPRICCASPNLAFARNRDLQPPALASGDDRVLEKRALSGMYQRVRPKNCSQLLRDNSRTAENSADMDPDAMRSHFLHDVSNRKASALLRCLPPAFHEFRSLLCRQLRRLVIHKTRYRAIPAAATRSAGEGALEFHSDCQPPRPVQPSQCGACIQGRLASASTEFMRTGALCKVWVGHSCPTKAVTAINLTFPGKRLRWMPLWGRSARPTRLYCS